jgi:hypothetical protein
MKIMIYIRAEVTFCHTSGNSLQILAEICEEDIHLVSLSNCKFHKNRYNEDHTLILVTLLPYFLLFFLIGVKFSTGDDVDFAAKVTLAESFL